MTVQELRTLLNSYGLEERPKTLEVSADTYANVCQATFRYLFETGEYVVAYNDVIEVVISLGPDKGIMFKDVELILKQDEQQLNT